MRSSLHWSDPTPPALVDTATMPRDDPSVNESDFVHAALAKGLRTDGRTPYEMRKLELSFGDQLGWVECRLGQTKSVTLNWTLSSGLQRVVPGWGEC